MTYLLQQPNFLFQITHPRFELRILASELLDDMLESPQSFISRMTR